MTRLARFYACRALLRFSEACIWLARRVAPG